MERGLYIAASGMLAEQVRQDQLANDLANASTPGYKADRAAQADFGQLLLENRMNGDTIGTLGVGVGIAEIRTDLTQAPLRQTGEPLDVALQGNGFLAVQAPQGIRYTRDGQLSVDAQGRLVNEMGLPVLGTGDAPITLGGTDGVTIEADGTISRNGALVGKLEVVSLQGPQKEGDTLFTGQPGAAPAGTTVKQGFLEGSGVNPAKAMVDMIVSLRAFESSQRVIHAIDETLGKGIDSAGSTGG